MLDTAEHDTVQNARPDAGPNVGPHTEARAMPQADRPADLPPVQQHSQHFEVPPVPPVDNDTWLSELDASPDMGRPLPPQVPPQPPKKRWFGGRAKQGKAVPQQAADEPPGPVKSRIPLKPLMYASLCGIALVSYLQYGPTLDKAQDLLGTTLPSVEPTGPTDPDLIMPTIDPRLGGPDALSLGMAAQPVHAQEDASGPAVDAVDTLGQTGAPVVNTALVEPLAASPAVAAPAAQTVTQPMTQASLDPALDERIHRMEWLMMEMSKQLAQIQAQQAAAGAPTPAPVPAPAAAARPVAQPAPVPQASPAATAPAAPQRLLVNAEPAKSTSTPARAAQPKPQPQRVARAQPVTKAKAVETEAPAKPQAASPRLISVDMWNGEPSVVVASGIPGDKRMRVLRPGDVVNGMALRSVDPVSRSVTFSGPNSQAVTLSMATGG